MFIIHWRNDLLCWVTQANAMKGKQNWILGGCNMKYSSKNHLKLKSCKLLVIHNIYFNRQSLSNFVQSTALLLPYSLQNCENDWTTDKLWVNAILHDLRLRWMSRTFPPLGHLHKRESSWHSEYPHWPAGLGLTWLGPPSRGLGTHCPRVQKSIQPTNQPLAQNNCLPWVAHTLRIVL